MLLPACLAAQTKVEISVNANYRAMAEREPISSDFAAVPRKNSNCMDM